MSSELRFRLRIFVVLPFLRPANTAEGGTTALECPANTAERGTTALECIFTIHSTVVHAQLPKLCQTAKSIKKIKTSFFLRYIYHLR